MDVRAFHNGKLVVRGSPAGLTPRQGGKAHIELTPNKEAQPQVSGADERAAPEFHNGRLVVSGSSKVLTPRRGGKAQSDLTPDKEVQPQVSGADDRASFETLVKSHAFLALSLPSCPQCDDLAAALAARGVPAPSVFVKWDKNNPEYPALKAALSVYAGASFTFPQVFAAGVYQGGFADVMPKLEMGAYDATFEENFGTEPITVKRWVERQPMAVFSLPNCPQCDELYELLERRGVPVNTIFIKWDKAMPQYQSLKAQLIRLIGRNKFTFPQTFVRSEYQGNFDEVLGKVNAGSFDDFLAEAFGIAKPDLNVTAPPEDLVLELDDDF